MDNLIAIIKARVLYYDIKPIYPLNVFWLANHITGKPIQVNKEDFPVNICAMILNEPDYDKTYIAVNKNRTTASQRFAIVHELAHVYLGHRGKISVIEDEEDPVLRAEADAFATELLAPKDRILSLACKYSEPFHLIYQIRKSHNVSLEMTCRRLLELEIFRGAFVCFNESGSLFNYKTEGFNIDLNRILNLPKIERGCSIIRRGTINGIPMTLHYQRFKQSGKYLAAWIDDTTTSDNNPNLALWA